MKAYRPSQHPDSGNLQRAAGRKKYVNLDDEDVRYVKRHPELSTRDLATFLNVDWNTIDNLRKGKSHRTHEEP